MDLDPGNGQWSTVALGEGGREGEREILIEERAKSTARNVGTRRTSLCSYSNAPTFFPVRMAEV